MASDRSHAALAFSGEKPERTWMRSAPACVLLPVFEFSCQLKLIYLASNNKKNARTLRPSPLAPHGSMK
jgi:hypothetical protein